MFDDSSGLLFSSACGISLLRESGISGSSSVFYTGGYDIYEASSMGVVLSETG